MIDPNNAFILGIIERQSDLVRQLASQELRQHDLNRLSPELAGACQSPWLSGAGLTSMNPPRRPALMCPMARTAIMPSCGLPPSAAARTTPAAVSQPRSAGRKVSCANRSKTGGFSMGSTPKPICYPKRTHRVSRESCTVSASSAALPNNRGVP
jgi:hypothetical protein